MVDMEAYYRGVRLVKTEIDKLIKTGALIHKIPAAAYRGQSIDHPSFHRYVVVENHNVDLEMLYGTKRILGSNLWELFYTQPCAGLTFIAESNDSVKH